MVVVEEEDEGLQQERSHSSAPRAVPRAAAGLHMALR